jgi:two-component system nitrate/nitrite response regulator NarP
MPPKAGSAQPAVSRTELALADGNPLMLAALSEFFDRDPRFSLVFTTSTAEGFLAAIARAPVQVGVIDWGLPQMGGEALLAALRTLPQTPRIVVYGASDATELVRRVMAVGAAGFCSRTSSPDRLLEVTMAAAMGQMAFPFIDVRELSRDPMQSLTGRERTMLAALARGLTNKALAELLGVSVNTVKFHLRNLFEKLAVTNRAQAVAFFYSHRAGDPPPG